MWNRAVYFTSFAGGDVDLHEVRTFIRSQGFEPQVIKETSQLADQREHRRERSGWIYKPKGVDIGLAVRVLEEAHRDIFDRCFLFTSDVDYLLVIEDVRRTGKSVVVCGYPSGLGDRSALEYVPDLFINLEDRVKQYTVKVE